MKDSNCKLLFPLFYILTAITLAGRFVLQFTQIDMETGFYYATTAGTVSQWAFLALLILSAVLLFWFSRMHFRPSAQVIIPPLGKAAFAVLIVAGLLCEKNALFTGALEIFALMDGYSLSLKVFLPALLDVICGLFLLYFGFLGFQGKQHRVGLVCSVVIILWSAALLISTFLSYAIVYQVSDNLLHILALVCVAFLFVSLFKALMGVGRGGAVRRTVLFGLFTAYFGVVLALPRLVLLWMNRFNVLVPSAKDDALYLLLALAVFGFLAAWGAAHAQQEGDVQPAQFGDVPPTAEGENL